MLDALRRRGSASRAELARITGLSRSTISGLVTDLVGDGLLEERAETSQIGAQGGRPGTLIALHRSAGGVVAIDFGHTHLRVAVADLSAEILAEGELELDVDRSATASLDAAAGLVTELLSEAGLELGSLIGTAMGLPGPVDRRTGSVGSSVILPNWADLKPAHELTNRLGGDVGVIVDNDANLAVLGEARWGAGEGAGDVVYVKVASGIGAGILIDGKLHRGASGTAGELGHVLVDPEGHICRCGNRGCLETVAGARPLLELLHQRLGVELTARDLVTMARDGDLGCQRVLVDAGRAIGKALADLANVLGPERIVIGGDLGGEGSPMIDGVRESLQRYALPAVVGSVTLRGGQLGTRAALLGGLSLVIGDTERLGSERIDRLGRHFRKPGTQGTRSHPSSHPVTSTPQEGTR